MIAKRALKMKTGMLYSCRIAQRGTRLKIVILYFIQGFAKKENFIGKNRENALKKLKSFFIFHSLQILYDPFLNEFKCILD